jgi:hypothetical protein
MLKAAFDEVVVEETVLPSPSRQKSPPHGATCSMKEVIFELSFPLSPI